mgnify:FL=1
MEVNIDEVLEICQEFLNVPSVVGGEKPLLNYLKKKAQKLGYNVDLNENFLHIKPNNNSSPKIIFSVHIDRQGFMLNNGRVEYASHYLKKEQGIPSQKEKIEPEEKKIYKKLEELEEVEVSLEKNSIRFNSEKLGIKNLKFERKYNADFLEKMASRYTGEEIISYNGDGKRKDKFKILRYDLEPENGEIYFELDKKLGKKDNIFMLNPELKNRDNKFWGQIDNAISVAGIFYLMENKSMNQEVIFTIREEIGQSYKSILDFYEKKENGGETLIVLDTSPYHSFKDKEDGFLVLRHGDERSGFDEDLIREIRKILDNGGVPYNFKPSHMGKTELGKVSKETGGKINGATIQLPSLNYHTSYETSTFESLKNYIKVIAHLASK